MTDSLHSVLNTAKEDTHKVNLLIQLADEFSDNDTRKALQYSNQALLLSEKINYKKGMANACGRLGNIYVDQGEYNKAKEYCIKCLSICEDIGEKKAIGIALNDMGSFYYCKGDYSESLDYYLRSLAMRKEAGDQKGAASTLNNIGLVYYSKGDYDKAIECYIKALSIKEKLGNKKGIAATYNTIGAVYDAQKNYKEAIIYFLKAISIYQEIGNKNLLADAFNNTGTEYQKLGDSNNALEYHLKSLEIRKELLDKGGMSASFNNIGIIYESEKKYDLAVEYYLKSLEIDEELGDKLGMAVSYNNIGHLYSLLERQREAEKFLLEGLHLAQQIGRKETVKDSYENISNFFSRKKEYKLAYDYHKKYSELKDSLLNEESSKQIAEMQTKYETEKKEQQITLLNKDKELQDAQLNRQKIIIWSVAGGLLIVISLSIFIFRERRKSEKLLLNILPAETAMELKANGKATAKHYESVTVMFTDFKGFTTIAEKLSAEELVSELDFIFKKFDEIISKYNIEKIKTIGDAYMCTSGLPTLNSNHAEEIIKAAMEIQQWMTSPQTTPDSFSPLQVQRGLRGEARWQLRIGIHSGPVTAGVVGDKKFAYDIWGDTVNTASRMESSGEAGKINISGATYQLVKDSHLTKGGTGDYQFTHRGKIPAKNKGEIDMYFVEAL